MFSGAGGSLLQDLGAVRYGGSNSDSIVFFRIYGQRFDQKSTALASGLSAKDAWNNTQGGFRVDYYPSDPNTFTLQGDFYGGMANSSARLINTDGQNVLGRFTHLFLIAPDKIKLTIGGKFLHNVFSGFEFQPSSRIAWTPSERHTVWTSVSRSVRTPSRFDSDVTATPVKFDSEKVIAYELGYRVRPMDKLSLSFAAFYNQYIDLRSIDTLSSGSPVTLVLANSQEAQSWGFEISGNFQVKEWWRLRVGYTYFEKDIYPISPKVGRVRCRF